LLGELVNAATEYLHRLRWRGPMAQDPMAQDPMAQDPMAQDLALSHRQDEQRAQPNGSSSASQRRSMRLKFFECRSAVEMLTQKT